MINPLINQLAFPKGIETMGTGISHAATLAKMLKRALPKFDAFPPTEGRFTAVVLPLRGLEANRRLEEMGREYLTQLAPLLNLGEVEPYLVSGRGCRHLTLMGIGRKSFDSKPTILQSLAGRIAAVLPDVKLAFHIAGLFFTLNEKRGLNIGARVYTDDQALLLLQQSRALIRKALAGVSGIDQEYLDLVLNAKGQEAESERGPFRPQISLFRIVPGPESCPFGPLAGTPAGEILTRAADPVGHYLGSIEVSLQDFVLRTGIGIRLQVDPDAPDLALK